MFVTELDTFIQKFHQLWQAGVTAHLDLDTHAGQAWVGLKVMLGSGPVYKDQRRPPTAKNRSPSYFRRQARRKETREGNDAE